MLQSSLVCWGLGKVGSNSSSNNNTILCVELPTSYNISYLNSLKTRFQSTINNICTCHLLNSKSCFTYRSIETPLNVNSKCTRNESLTSALAHSAHKQRARFSGGQILSDPSRANGTTHNLPQQHLEVH